MGECLYRSTGKVGGIQGYKTRRFIKGGCGNLTKIALAFCLQASKSFTLYLIVKKMD
jgi:hypothetical protein